jgi:hypothetical protein
MELVKILQSKSNGENKIQSKSSQNAMFDDSNNNLEDPDNLQEPNHNIQVEKMKNWEKVIQILKNSLS